MSALRSSRPSSRSESRRRRAAGLGETPVIVGGIIPEDDRPVLEEAGVAAVYTPKDFELAKIMADINDLADA